MNIDINIKVNKCRSNYSLILYKITELPIKYSLDSCGEFDLRNQNRTGQIVMIINKEFDIK